MASIESLKRQINVARGRIQRERNRLRKAEAAGRDCPSARELIAREQAFIRVAKQAIDAEGRARRLDILSDHLVIRADFAAAIGH